MNFLSLIILLVNSFSGQNVKVVRIIFDEGISTRMQHMVHYSKLLVKYIIFTVTEQLFGMTKIGKDAELDQYHTYKRIYKLYEEIS